MTFSWFRKRSTVTQKKILLLGTFREINAIKMLILWSKIKK